MNNSVNLIPQELSVPKSVSKLTKSLNSLSTLLFVLTVLTGLLILGSYFFFSNEMNKLNTDNERLKTEIANLNKNEQSLMLVKDRLTKIATIKKMNSANKGMANFKTILTFLQSVPDVVFNEISFDSKKVDASFLAKSSDTLTSFLSFLVEPLGFKRIVLSSLGYSSVGGYTFNLSFE